jgi:hypothetical protein
MPRAGKDSLPPGAVAPCAVLALPRSHHLTPSTKFATAILGSFGVSRIEHEEQGRL